MNYHNLGVAEQRRNEEVTRISKSIASLDREIGQGINDVNGM